MHLMVADFGSSKILPEDYDYESAQLEIEKNQRMENEESEDSEIEKSGEQRHTLKRKASFVGTAQYVSPEILKGQAAHLSTDLWSYGCIIYQMISGVHLFKGATEYLIFQKILNGHLEFEEGFNPIAEDLIRKLLRFNPTERIGSDDSKENRYQSIRNHSYFHGIDWNSNLYTVKPPEMNLPRDLRLDSSREQTVNFHADSEPGLGERQERRILQMEFHPDTVDADQTSNTGNWTLTFLNFIDFLLGESYLCYWFRKSRETTNRAKSK
jgi:3-phosphoinositide dependent protein kinase-1